MLKDKVTIITGAGQGIGRAIALTCAKHGAHVVVNDINLENARQVAEETRILGARSLALQADVTDEKQVRHMIEECVEHFSRVEIMVNNAGIVLTGPLTDVTTKQWDRLMAINLKGVFLCCKAVLPLMMAQRGGKIINIASIAGKRGGGLLGNSCYAASKGGVIALTKGIAREAGPYGINVNAVAPGLTDTEMTNGLTLKQREALLQTVPLGRSGRPEDIASAVCFLASDHAAFITGEIMDVDGGVMMD